MVENVITQMFYANFGRQLESMEKSIEATMKKETVYSCALLLSTYTEILGGLVTGKLKDSNEMRNNYVAFLGYLGSKYVELHKKYDLYKNVRSKLVHEFSPRPSYVIWINEKPQDDRNGIEIIDGHLNFHLKEYYRDFQQGVNCYLEKWTREPMLIINFGKAMSIDWQNTTLKEKL